MKSRFISFLMIIMVHILSVNCRPLAPPPATFKEIPPHQSTMALEQGGSDVVEKRIGSRPPRCEHKCYGCSPCEATQVPTITSGPFNASIQYSNYEPEGWKCKCGPTFYSP